MTRIFHHHILSLRYQCSENRFSDIQANEYEKKDISSFSVIEIESCEDNNQKTIIFLFVMRDNRNIFS